MEENAVEHSTSLQVERIPNLNVLLLGTLLNYILVILLIAWHRMLETRQQCKVDHNFFHPDSRPEYLKMPIIVVEPNKSMVSSTSWIVSVKPLGKHGIISVCIFNGLCVALKQQPIVMCLAASHVEI